MAAGQIGTDRVGSTRRFETFVDINASRTRWLESVAAETLAVQAFGIVDAIEIAFAIGRHIHLRKTRRTNIVTLSRSARKRNSKSLKNFRKRNKNLRPTRRTEIDDCKLCSRLTSLEDYFNNLIFSIRVLEAVRGVTRHLKIITCSQAISGVGWAAYPCGQRQL